MGTKLWKLCIHILLFQGWDDVSFHGSDQIMTPNIDVIAYQGAMLQQYYTDTQGTPTRSALFTGKYPMRLGETFTTP